jgi:dTDP-4-dehydrorhamnose reductase
MRVLITGGSSLLAKYLYQTKPENIELFSTWYTNHVDNTDYHLDIGNKSQVAYVLNRCNPNVIIHCAALGNVDFTERNYQQAKHVLVDGIENLLKWAAHSKVVYISSNAVYDGNNPPYKETSYQKPINNYGRLKNQAERAILDHKGEWLIIRPFLLYGWPNAANRSNWGSMIVNSLKAGKSVQLVNDVVWQPTYAYDCASAIWNLLLYSYESYNVASNDSVTLYDFGLKIAEIFGLDADLLEPVASDYFPMIARRPRDTSYDLSKINGMKIKFNLLSGLERFRDEL